MRKRIYFFFPNDVTVIPSLETAEKAIFHYLKEDPQDINEVLEMFHIQKLFECGQKPENWSDEKFTKLKQSTESYNKQIADFFNTLTSKEIEDSYKDIDFNYIQTFWDIIDRFDLNILSPDTFQKLASRNLHHVLRCKKIVSKHKSTVKEILLKHPDAAPILVDTYISASSVPYHIPANLSMQEKEQIINSYLDSDSPNLNIIRLICQNKDEKDKLILNPVTKEKAARLSKKLNAELLESNKKNASRTDSTVEFSDDENAKPYHYEYHAGKHRFIYSIPFIRHCNRVQKVLNCIKLFHFMNPLFMIELISKVHETSPFETTFIQLSKNSYPAYLHFRMKNTNALRKLLSYNEILIELGTSFEKELKYFYETYLKEKYSYPSLSLHFPEPEYSWIDKCRIILPELENIAKQYRAYVEYDTISSGILQHSKPLKTTEVPSLLTNKYYEMNATSGTLIRITNDLFRKLNNICRIGKNESYKYNCLYNLLIHETIFYEDFESHQKLEIDFLIEHGILCTNEKRQVLIAQDTPIEVLLSLWEYHACSYWHFNSKDWAFIEKMYEKGWLKPSEFLFTSEERKYYSYYLDNQMFTNGLEYRNQYMHGSPNFNHQIVYYRILLLLTMLFLKIEDDLFLAEKASMVGIAEYHNVLSYLPSSLAGF